MSDFIIRLQEEKNELHSKMVKLERFLNSDGIEKVSSFQRVKLKEQYAHMQGYYGCLNLRLRDLEEHAH